MEEGTAEILESLKNEYPSIYEQAKEKGILPTTKDTAAMMYLMAKLGLG